MSRHKKAAAHNLAQSVRAAQLTRLRARSILMGARRALARQGTAAAEEAVRSIDAVLK
jgi:hypothetical protein